MRKGQMLRTGQVPSPGPGLEKYGSVGVENRKLGSFSVDRAKNGIILCETAQKFLSLTFKKNFYINYY